MIDQEGLAVTGLAKTHANGIALDQRPGDEYEAHPPRLEDVHHHALGQSMEAAA